MGSSIPHPLSIQEYRFLFYSCSLPSDRRFNKVRASYIEAFTYEDMFGKRKLMNEHIWKEFKLPIKKEDLYIFEINGESKKKWNTERNKEIELFKRGKITMDKVRREYFDNPYIEVSMELWNQIKIGTLNELKLFHFILWHKVNGPYPIIKTTIEEIQNRLMMGNYPHKLIERLTPVLDKYVSMKIIKSYKWNKHFLEIEKGTDGSKKGTDGSKKGTDGSKKDTDGSILPS